MNKNEKDRDRFKKMTERVRKTKRYKLTVRAGCQILAGYSSNFGYRIDTLIFTYSQMTASLQELNNSLMNSVDRR